MRIYKDVTSRPKKSLIVSGVEVVVMCWTESVWPCYIFIDYQHAVAESGKKISKEKLEESHEVVNKVLHACEKAGFKVLRDGFELRVFRGVWIGPLKLAEREALYGSSYLTNSPDKALLEEAILAELTARLCSENQFSDKDKGRVLP